MNEEACGKGASAPLSLRSASSCLGCARGEPSSIKILTKLTASMCVHSMHDYVEGGLEMLE